LSARHKIRTTRHRSAVKNVCKQCFS
jgi:hypothetical protein